jgi:hypothetical protein
MLGFDQKVITALSTGIRKPNRRLRDIHAEDKSFAVGHYFPGRMRWREHTLDAKS